MSHHSKNTSLMLSILIFILHSFNSANASPQQLTPKHIDQQITIDGILDESAWNNTPSISDFTVVTPDTGASPTHPTNSKILYSDKGIYFAIENFQPHDTQVERMTSRDIEVERDNVRLVLDTSGRGLYGYVFTVALGGSLIDGTVKPERDFSYEWNAPWQAQTKRYTDRWDAEVFIPWSALKLSSAVDKRTIGLSIERHISYLAEDWAVPALSNNRSVFLSALLPVQFDVIETQSELTFVPYLSSSLDRLNHNNDSKFGFDLYYQPTSDSQLSLTVSPDFGQVENDDIVVNFSAFETYSPEKRAFFLEGQEIFNPNGIMMVNTRRIGSAPITPILEDGQTISQSKGFSAVTAAAKYTGQLGKMRYGVLSATEEDSDFLLDDGSKINVDGRQFVALRSIYETNNAQGDYQAIGMMSTLVEHQDGHASAHMIDGEYRTDDEKWQIDTQLYFSDKDQTKGYGQWAHIQYSPVPGHEHGIRLRHADDDLALNDMGYLERNDETRFMYYHRLPEKNDPDHYKSFKMGQWFDYRINRAGERLNARIGHWINYQFNDLTRFRFTIHYTGKRWDDRNSRGNGSFRTDDFLHLWTRWQSDSSQNFSYGVSAFLRQEQIDGGHYNMSPFINYSPTDNINIDAELTLKSRDNWLIWQQDKLFNSFKQKQLNLTVKSTWIIDNQQELRLAMQWVGLSAQSKQAYRINDNGDLYPSSDIKADHFDQADLALQLRYKYQFAPLSDLYLVYSRGGHSYEQHNTENQGFGDLLSDSFKQKNADQLTMKLSYRF